MTAVIDTTPIDRAAWLTERRLGLGGSDVSAVLGFRPYNDSASPFSLWADKVGLLPDRPDNDSFEFGRWAEHMVGPWFTDKKGLHLTLSQARVHQAEHPWRRCTLDGAASETPRVDCPHHNPGPLAGPHAGCATLEAALGLVQIKTDWHSPRWDEMPPHYQAQGQWELHVAEKDHEWWPVLHGRRLEVYELARDDADIALIVERVDEFWHNHVLPGVPPPVDGTDATWDALAALYPDRAPDDAVDIGHMVDVVAELREAKAAKTAAETREKAAKNQLAAAIGGHSVGTIDGQRAISITTQTRTTTCKECGHSTTSKPFPVLRPHTTKEKP